MRLLLLLVEEVDFSYPWRVVVNPVYTIQRSCVDLPIDRGKPVASGRWYYGVNCDTCSETHRRHRYRHVLSTISLAACQLDAQSSMGLESRKLYGLNHDALCLLRYSRPCSVGAGPRDDVGRCPPAATLRGMRYSLAEVTRTSSCSVCTFTSGPPPSSS